MNAQSKTVVDTERQAREQLAPAIASSRGARWTI